jgi:hypothetical protein
MNHLPGEYAKVVGGDFGVYWDGKSWKTFGCLGCAIASSLIVPANRLQWTTKVQTLYRKRIEKRLAQLKASREKQEVLDPKTDLHDDQHDPCLHKTWLYAGKPHRKD